MTSTSSSLSPLPMAPGLRALALGAAVALPVLEALDDSRTVDLDGLPGVYSETVDGDGLYLLAEGALDAQQTAALDRLGVEPDVETGLIVVPCEMSNGCEAAALTRLVELATEAPDSAEAADLLTLRDLFGALAEATVGAAGDVAAPSALADWTPA